MDNVKLKPKSNPNSDPKQKNIFSIFANKLNLIFLIIIVFLLVGTGILLKKYTMQEKKQLTALVNQEKVGLLYVVRGQAIVQDNVLTVKSDLVEWFTDRPVHEAGRLSVQELTEQWDEAFLRSAPNISIIGAGADAVVEVDKASFDQDKIFLEYKKIIDGNLSEGNIGEVSIFIDSTIMDCGSGSLNFSSAEIMNTCSGNTEYCPFSVNSGKSNGNASLQSTVCQRAQGVLSDLWNQLTSSSKCTGDPSDSAADCQRSYSVNMSIKPANYDESWSCSMSGYTDYGQWSDVSGSCSIPGTNISVSVGSGSYY